MSTRTDIDVTTPEAATRLHAALERHGAGHLEWVSVASALAELAAEGWPMEGPAGPDVRDRIVDRLTAERAEMVEHWARMKEPAGPASAAPFVALDRMLGDPPEIGLRRELASDEIAYFEARRASEKPGLADPADDPVSTGRYINGTFVPGRKTTTDG